MNRGLLPGFTPGPIGGFGNKGKVLTGDGLGNGAWAPQALALIGTQTANNTASLSWTGLSGYAEYLLSVKNLAYSTSSSGPLLLQFGSGSAASPTWNTSGYQYSGVFNQPTAGTVQARASTGLAGFPADMNLEGSGSTPIDAELFIHAASGAVFLQMFVNNGGSYYWGVAGGNGPASSLSAIRLISTANSLQAGTASLYGVNS